MGVKWTEQQQKVIDLRNRNILVSAAAGSGKTAVLCNLLYSVLIVYVGLSFFVVQQMQVFCNALPI